MQYNLYKPSTSCLKQHVWCNIFPHCVGGGTQQQNGHRLNKHPILSSPVMLGGPPWYRSKTTGKKHQISECYSSPSEPKSKSGPKVDSSWKFWWLCEVGSFLTVLLFPRDSFFHPHRTKLKVRLRCCYIKPDSWVVLPSMKLTVCPWKKIRSFWAGAMLVSGMVFYIDWF